MIDTVLEQISASNGVKLAIIFAIVLFIVSFMKLKGSLNTKNIAFIGLLIAMSIILKRFISIELANDRIGFTYFATAMMGALFGPWVGGAANVIADFIGMILFPKGAFFPGFTLTAFLEGFVYGLLLYKKEIKMKDTIIASVIVGVFLHLGLNSIWLHMLNQNPIWTQIAMRIPKQLIVIPLESITLGLVMPRLVKEIRNMFRQELSIR
ncbi:MAG: folate family ECF transporter S component [Tissierellia bacterium]|nr:folate family ECF transporter S component [Tissierellia bacterium]